MKRQFYLVSFLLSFCLANVLFAQNPIPAKEQSKPILIKGAKVHIGNGQVLQNASISIVDGKIKEVKEGDITVDDSYEVIDATGKEVYPGLILPSTTLGIRELDALRQSNDHKETGNINSSARAVIAFNTDSDITPTVRTNGVLVAQSTPRGGLIAGNSAIMELDGWNWEDAALKADDGIHLNWPKILIQTGWWAEPGPKVKNPKGDQDREELNKFFDDAVSYSKSGVKGGNIKLEAMLGLFDGSKRLYLYADNAKEIIEAVAFAKEKMVKKIVVVGGRDAWMIPDFMKENDIPVILDRVFEIPSRANDDTDLMYKLPAKLQKLGIKYCLAYKGDMEAMGSRNLPFSAGFAAAFGLSKEEALRAVTLSTAEILGVENRLGSIEAGKDATIVISEGDLLDMRTNKVSHAFIRGKSIELTNKQTELYNKYQEKYGFK